MLQAGRLQLSDHLPAGAPGPADDDVVGQLLDLLHGGPGAEGLSQVHLDDGRGDEGEPESHGGDAAHEQDAGERPPRVVQGPDLLVAHGGEGDDRHVQGVGERPAGELEEAHGPDG